MEVNSDAVTTAWDLQESVQRAKTRLAVTASYPREGRSSYSRLSSSVLEAAATSAVVLDTISTRTITLLSSPTSGPLVNSMDSVGFGDSWAGPERVEGQNVLG